jgi:hypothetical protein
MSKVASMSQSSSQRKHSRPEWNMHLTDDDQFKLTKQELLKKKKMLLSKHNILTNGGNTPVKTKVRRFKKIVTRDSSEPKPTKPLSKTEKSEVSAPTSLDLLGYDSESDGDSSANSFCSP